MHFSTVEVIDKVVSHLSEVTYRQLVRAASRGGGGEGHSHPPPPPPLLDVCPPLRFIVWLWHIEFASPGMPGRLFCLPLKKILNAALLVVLF